MLTHTQRMTTCSLQRACDGKDSLRTSSPTGVRSAGTPIFLTPPNSPRLNRISRKNFAFQAAPNQAQFQYPDVDQSAPSEQRDQHRIPNFNGGLHARTEKRQFHAFKEDTTHRDKQSSSDEAPAEPRARSFRPQPKASADFSTGSSNERSEASTKKNYFEILGVEKDCSEQVLKKAYKKLAVKLHPDKNPNDPSAQERFSELNEAFTVLSDPNRREEYTKEICASDDAGWGWNAEAAKRNAANYVWTGDEMLFQIGDQLNSARNRARRQRSMLSCFGACLGD